MEGFYPLTADQSPHFYPVCLRCGARNFSRNYTCKCGTEPWTNKYRSIDLRLNLQQQRKLGRESFNRYSLDHPQGILQYKLLPGAFDSTGQPPVGLTPLFRLSYFNDRQVYMKYEGANPSGCFKDRETLPCLLHSNRKGMHKAVIYSSGNAAASAASMANRERGFELVTFVSGDTYPEKIEYIRRRGSNVVIIGNKDTHYETGYTLFSNLNHRNVFSDLGYDNWSVRNPYRVQGDKSSAVEIVKQLSESNEKPVVPDYVIVPTANGSCLAGIWKGFRELYRLGLISQLPRMVSVGIAHANPVCEAVRRRQISAPVRCDLSRVDPHDADAGSTMVAEEGYDVMQAAKAVLESNGVALEVHTKDVQQAYFDYLDHQPKQALQQKYLPEPASMLPLAALDKLGEQRNLSPESKIVAVATGSAAKAINAVEKLLAERQDLKQEFRRRISPPTVQNSGGTCGRKFHVEASEEALTETLTQMQKAYA